MAWWIRVLEIADIHGRGIGKYRLTAKSDENSDDPFGLCNHEHDTPELAQNCSEAKDTEWFV